MFIGVWNLGESLEFKRCVWELGVYRLYFRIGDLMRVLVSVNKVDESLGWSLVFGGWVRRILKRYDWEGGVKLGIEEVCKFKEGCFFRRYG